MTSPALERPVRTLDEALADRLRNMSHWLSFAAKRLDMARANPGDAQQHIAAASHFLMLAIRGVAP